MPEQVLWIVLHRVGISMARHLIRPRQHDVLDHSLDAATVGKETSCQVIEQFWMRWPLTRAPQSHRRSERSLAPSSGARFDSQ